VRIGALATTSPQDIGVSLAGRPNCPRVACGMLGRVSDDAVPRPAVEPGLCAACAYVSVNETRRGTVDLRCTRAAWDERLVRYPRLPVLSCVGYASRGGPATDPGTMAGS
jgi:hypothetical protein